MLKMLEDKVNPDDISSITIMNVPQSGNINVPEISITSDSVRISGRKDTSILNELPSINIREFKMPQTYLGVGTTKDAHGAKVTEVVAGSPAEKAGILIRDFAVA